MRMLEKEPDERWPTMDDVVAVCGRPSLRHDDPIRSEMITLARAGPEWRLLTDIDTPTSPIALAKARTRPLVSAPRRTWRRWWGLGAVAIAVALWWAAPWRSLRGPTAPAADTVIARAPGTPLVAETGVVRSPPESLAARGTPPVARRRSEPTAPRRTPPSAAADQSLLRPDGARREDSIVSSLRSAALAALRRAVVAGATPAELARGDTVYRGADSLATAGRPSEAMVPFVTATSLWSEAERLSHARAARDSARPAPSATGHPPPAPPADPRGQIELAIAEYARALESRDLGQVRRAYPGLTVAQQQGWQDFFKSVRTLKATLSVTSVSVSDGSADVSVMGVYEFANATTGRLERRPVTFRAILVAEPVPPAWRLSVVR
jgi:hypothetical protein